MFHFAFPTGSDRKPPPGRVRDRDQDAPYWDLMKARLVTFGLVELDGRKFDRDVLVEGGRVFPRRKKASKPQRDRYGHTPLTTAEPLPWRCRQLIVGTGVEGRLPIAPEVIEEARRRGVELIMLPTAEACARLSAADAEETAAVLHVTC